MQKLKYIYTALISFTLLLILLNPKQCIDAALSGAKLFYYNLFPSLFIFLILCNLLIFFNGVEIYSKLLGKLISSPLRLTKNCTLAVIISILCGYPLGTKYTLDLYSNDLISKEETERLLSIASNPSPIFVIGAIGAAMFKNITYGYIILLSNYLSCFIISLFLKPCNERTFKTPISPPSKNKKINLGEALKLSVDNALKTTLSVGGFIVFFSLISAILNDTLFFFIKNDITKTTFSGLLEMTQGCNLIINSNYDDLIKISFVSFFVTFSGFSVIAQIYSFLYKYPISLFRYIKIKFLQGIISALVTILMYKAYSSIPMLTTSVISIDKPVYNGIYLILSLIFVLPLFLYLVKSLFTRN